MPSRFRAFPILEGASRAPHEPADGPRLWKCRLRERHDGALPGAGALGQHHECVDGVVHFVFFFAERYAWGAHRYLRLQRIVSPLF